MKPDQTPAIERWENEGGDTEHPSKFQSEGAPAQRRPEICPECTGANLSHVPNNPGNSKPYVSSLSNQTPRHPMKWSFKLGKLFGIDVYLHFTFLLLLVFLGSSFWQSTQSFPAAVQGLLFVLALFGCVVLHEVGHALMARRYGIQTRDITLLPIGGIARLEKMPEKPIQELWVALAGPAVNLVIAFILWFGLVVTGSMTTGMGVSATGHSFWQSLLILNLILVVFNLLPAFPMDGGRVLRALLAMRLGRRRATGIAANVGQVMAILFGIVGFFYNPFLIFIGIFVYLGAQAEAGLVEMQSALSGLRVRDAMITRFRTLTTGDVMTQAVEMLLEGSQHDFPVMEDGQPVGMLRRNDLVKALNEGQKDASVSEGMCHEHETLDADTSLTSAVESMTAQKCATMPVMSDGHLVGLLTLENVTEMIMIHHAMEHHAAVTQ